ncbi:ATP-binding protein [Streptomyces sp. NRRL S-37]|uniref:ATP-binding protein n=1 Tax=Streptomyces sp. NRRL S-37 TaxID=1463903 RepID=UPI002D21EC37|nr:ATP-binding protein [Streptomyces sp. NRRL S-37]
MRIMLARRSGIRRVVPAPEVAVACSPRHPSGGSPMTVATAVATVMATSLPPLGYAAFEACFAAEPICVGRSRHVSSVFLKLCKVAEPLRESVVLCVSELVTNGVKHGTGDVALRVRCRGAEIRVEVVDGSSTPATLRGAEAEDTSGRGLALVRALSWEWGVSKDGRTTWCTFRIPAGGPR